MLSSVKYQFGFAVVAAALVLAGCASPAKPRQVPPPRNYQTEVVAEFDHALSGWNSGRLDMFMTIYADDATFALRDGFIQGAAGIREYYAPQFRPSARRSILRLEQLNVEVLSLDVVLVRAIYRSELDGEVTRGTTTLVMRHDANHWRIIHDHST